MPNLDPAPAGAYLTTTEADALAAQIPALVAYSAAAPAAKAQALVQASDDVDRAVPYQGRRYAADQAREFPRVAYEEPGAASRAHAAVWNWDPATNAAVVPREVALATLHQADAILAGAREPRLAAQHDGVVYDLTGTLAESYKRNAGPGVTTGLCRRAWVLVRRYRLKSGKLL